MSENANEQEAGFKINHTMENTADEGYLVLARRRLRHPRRLSVLAFAIVLGLGRGRGGYVLWMVGWWCLPWRPRTCKRREEREMEKRRSTARR